MPDTERPEHLSSDRPEHEIEVPAPDGAQDEDPSPSEIGEAPRESEEVAGAGADDQDKGNEAASETFDDRVERVLACVFSHPAFRELKYEMLAACADARKEFELEASIERSPHFPQGMQAPRTVIDQLVSAGGFSRTVLLNTDEEISEEELDGMSDEEYDEFFECYLVRTTEEGAEAVRRASPENRMDDLRYAHPVQGPGYLDVLRYIDERPRTRYEIERFCKGKSYLKASSNLGIAEVRPSHFIDKLERAGVIVWKDGWTINDAGKAYLASLDSAPAL